MILQLPKQNTPAPRRSRSEIGGISTDFLEDAPDPGRARSSPTQLASAQANVATGQRTLAASATNADDELLSRVTAVLDGVAAFRRLHVRVVLGDVTVRGSVDSPFEKHLLFHSLKRISGAKRWIDAVAVVAPKVPRESWLTRSSDSLSELRQWLTPRPSVRWGAAICAVALLLVLAPWAKRSHGIDTVPVVAQVLFEGQLAFGAFVTLHPIGESPLPNDVRPAGYVRPDGQVKFATFESQDGVPAGEYLVTVRWNKLVTNGEEATPGPNILPERYLLPTTSGLRITVAAGQTELPPLKLAR